MAVRQEDLDCLLSVRRWFRDLDGSRDSDAAVVSWQDSEPDSVRRRRELGSSPYLGCFSSERPSRPSSGRELRSRYLGLR